MLILQRSKNNLKTEFNIITIILMRHTMKDILYMKR